LGARKVALVVLEEIRLMLRTYRDELLVERERMARLLADVEGNRFRIFDARTLENHTEKHAQTLRSIIKQLDDVLSDMPKNDRASS
jgi:ribosomal protein L19E